MSTPTALEVLATPMAANDAGASTVRGYLIALLAEVWRFGEDFSGKQPFGNSGWEYDLFAALGKAGYIRATFDEDGYVENVDTDAGDRLIAAAIKALDTTGETETSP